jgi:hypothetical protein
MLLQSRGPNLIEAHVFSPYFSTSVFINALLPQGRCQMRIA